MVYKFHNATKDNGVGFIDLAKKYIKVGDLVNLSSRQYKNFYIKVEIVSVLDNNTKFIGKLITEMPFVFPDLKIGDQVEFCDYEIGQYLIKESRPDYKEYIYDTSALVKKEEATRKEPVKIGPIKSFNDFYDYTQSPRVNLEDTKNVKIGDTIYLGHREYEDLWLETRIVYVSDDKATFRGVITYTDPEIYKDLKLGDQVNFHNYEIASFAVKNR